ncbi:BrnA antitoxin family protein [Nodosilinea sp. AN01ver1]|uniref:BrnA antitoxin family protein n=1 Tax=Nodosilinea sp. AN01ver1 TaxID=3423362 RepID=UPI003D3131BC
MNESAMNNTSKTDWARIDAMTDDDIDTSDIPPLDEAFFAKAKLRMPQSTASKVTVSVDAETLSWFQSQGEGAEQHMAAALRIYAESQKQAALLHGQT